MTPSRNYFGEKRSAKLGFQLADKLPKDAPELNESSPATRKVIFHDRSALLRLAFQAAGRNKFNGKQDADRRLPPGGNPSCRS